jgi:DNA repair exonuclease SbcCD ATPase subunit
LEAISWILEGRVAGDTGVEDIANWEAGSGWGRLHLVKDTGDTLSLLRGHDGKNLRCELVVNGEPHEGGTPSSRHKEALRLLGMAEGDVGFSHFLQSHYLTSAKGTFPDKGSSECFLLVSHLLSLKVLETASKAMGTKAKKLEAELATLDGKLEGVRETAGGTGMLEELERDRGTLQMSLEGTETLLDVEQQKLEPLKAKAVRLEHLDMLVMGAKSAFNGATREYERFMSNAKKKAREWKTRRDRLGPAKEALMQLQTQFAEVGEPKEPEGVRGELNATDVELGVAIDAEAFASLTLQSLNAELAKGLECPECKTPLMSSAEGLKRFDLQDLKCRAREKAEELECRKASVASLEEQETELQGILDEYRDQVRERESLSKQIDSQKKVVVTEEEAVTNHEQWRAEGRQQKVEKEKRLAELKQEVADAETALEAVQDQDDAEDVQAIRTRIQELEAQVQQANQDLGSLATKIGAATKEADLLGTREEVAAKVGSYRLWERGFLDIRRERIKRFVPEFRGQTNRVLSRLETNLRVDYRVDVPEGRKREKFEILVQGDEGWWKPYGTRSKGERARVGLACSIALSQAMRARDQLALSLMMVDELTDGMDESGQTEFFRFISDFPGLVLVVTHSDRLKSMFEHTLTLIKEGGVARAA